MDRLPTLTFVVMTASIAGLCTQGCEDTPAAPTQRRVVAVTTDRPRGQNLESFCDISRNDSQAKQLALPPLDAQPAARSKSSWRWLNLWATWCRPCIEEMPMILRWRDNFEQEGTGIELSFLSVDESAEIVERYRKAHPTTPPSLRLADPEALAGWIASLGLDPGATLPIHVFADGNNKVRCVRSGALSDDHFETVQRLISSR